MQGIIPVEAGILKNTGFPLAQECLAGFNLAGKKQFASYDSILIVL